MNRRWVVLIITTIIIVLFLILYWYFFLGPFRTQLTSADSTLDSTDQVLKRICTGIVQSESGIVTEGSKQFCREVLT